MSVVYRLVEDLVEVLVDQVKKDIREYSHEVMTDLDVFADSIIKRAARAVVTALIGGVLLAVGLIFTLFGAVTFLTPVITSPLAWAVVGLASAILGAWRLGYLKLNGRDEAKHESRVRDGP